MSNRSTDDDRDGTILSITTAHKSFEHDISKDLDLFYPIAFQADCTDREDGMTEKLTLLVCLPCAIDYEADRVEVINEGQSLEVTVEWPQIMLDPESMMSPFINDPNWPRYTVDHPKIVAFEKSLKNLRMSAGKKRDEPMTSTARIKFPFQVGTNK